MGKVTLVELPPDPVVDRRDPPPIELGRDLKSIEDAHRWLSHPSNWIKSQLFIIKWDGVVPYIEESRGMELLREGFDKSILLSVISQQRERKSREDPDEIERSVWRDEQDQ